MPSTFFCDYEGGNDALDGLTFANRWKTITSGATAARIAPGDTIRVIGSPDPTNMGQSGQWTDGPLKATQAIASSTNATPIVVTLSGANYTALAPVVGETLIVNGHTTNTNANGVWTVGAVNGSTTVTLVNADGTNSVGNGVGGASGTVRKFTNAVVGLASAVTKNIAVCGNRGQKANWTASSNVTNTVITTDYKEGGECQQIAVAAGFTVGLAAYTSTGTLNLSAYQQVSFWIKQTVGTLGLASSLSLKLCSDTAGATPVNTINIPYIGAVNQWSPITVDLAGALGSSIQSIGFYINTDNGQQTFLLDNIIACKASSAADSLSLTSLISKDPGDHSYGDGYEAWFGIQGINGTRVVLDGPVNTIPGATPQRGYAGVTESVTLYKRETIKTVMAAATSTSVQLVNDAGVSGSLIAFSGGWNRADMSTQTGETWFDGQNGLGNGLNANTKAFCSADKLQFTRYQNGLYDAGSTSDWTVGICCACNTSAAPISFAGGPRLTATTLSAVCCGGAIIPGPGAVVQTIGRADSTTAGNGVTTGAGSWTGVIKQANNNTGIGVQSGVASYISRAVSNGNVSSGYLTGSKSVIGNLLSIGNSTYGVSASSAHNWAIMGGSMSANASGGITPGSSMSGVLRNLTIDDATEVIGFAVYNDGRIYSENHDATPGYSKIFCDGGLIETQTGIVHGSASRAWKFSPTSANRSQYYSLNLPIATVAVGASALVTIKGWFLRDNTGLTARLICKGGQLAGVASDVTAQMSAAANTWQELTVTFTPTESGVVEIEAQFWGGSTYNGYVSDLTISQA